MRQENIKRIVSEMTIEEKASLCSGADNWRTPAIEKLGIPSVMMSDCPHGLRKECKTDGSIVDESGTIKAVCFPAACATANSFDPKLLRKMGECLGEECQAEDVQILLGPGINIKRNPLCGRNFEYFSEDPCVAGELGTAFVEGVQSKGVGTSLKHFFANNQEYRRMDESSEIDERTKRELYLPAFEKVVKRAQPSTIMASYNRIDGTYSTENHRNLEEILRGEWGFEGVVVSDWGATHDRVKAVAGGTEITMPGAKDTDHKIVEAVQNGELAEDVLDRVCERVLTMVYHLHEQKRGGTINQEADHRLARQIAAESMVVLKNEGRLLPIPREKKIAFIGAFAKDPRYQCSGSSFVNNYRVTNAYDVALEEGISAADLLYAPGYDRFSGDTTDELITEAVDTAKQADVAVIFAGLPEKMESEGYDRSHMKMPQGHCRLIEEITRVQEHTVVVLYNGSAIELPWAEHVPAILEGYLSGEAVGEATIDVLFGSVNPSGHLAESFPVKLQDNPSYLFFPGEGEKVVYNERMFVGYRYYESKDMKVRFPFGHGLSYTTFVFSNMKLEKSRLQGGENLTLYVDVENAGNRDGKALVQIYVAPPKKELQRPVRELRTFRKVEVKAGEKVTVQMELTSRDFALWSEKSGRWVIEDGIYKIQVGISAHEIVLEEELQVESGSMKDMPHIIPMSPISDILVFEKGKAYWEAHVPEFIQGALRMGLLPEEVGAMLMDNPGQINQIPGLNNLFVQPLIMLTHFCESITEEEITRLCRELNEET